MAGTAALGQHGDAIDDGAANHRIPHQQVAGHDLDVADDATREPGHQPIGGVVLRVIDGRVKLCPRRGRGQAGKELQDLALIAGPGRRHLALFEHPGRGLQRQDGMMGHMVNRRPFHGRATADHGARRTDFQGLNSGRDGRSPGRCGLRRGGSLGAGGKLDRGGLGRRGGLAALGPHRNTCGGADLQAALLLPAGRGCRRHLVTRC